MEELVRFEEIKKNTNGYLDSTVYEELYNCALQAAKGVIIDIGPAQGGSSICFALAAKENKQIKKIYSIDKFKGSNALKDYYSIENNIMHLHNNLKKYNLQDFVRTIVAGVDDIKEIVKNESISILFIDADGAIDRDFELFYNQIIDHGIIIVDDYEKKINIQASTRYLKWRSDKEINIFLENEGIPNLKMFTPLGKHYTTYKFIEYLITNNYLEVIKIMDNTLFAKKPIDAPTFNNNTIEMMKQIRDNIECDYYFRRNIIKKNYDKIAEQINLIAKDLRIKNVLLFENYYYPAKNRMQTSKVLELHEEYLDNFENEIELQDINFCDIKEYKADLELGRIIKQNCNDIKCEVFSIFKNKYPNGNMIMLPIIIENNFWGFLIFYDNNIKQNININKLLMDNMIKVIKDVKDEITKAITV